MKFIKKIMIVATSLMLLYTLAACNNNKVGPSLKASKKTSIQKEDTVADRVNAPSLVKSGKVGSIQLTANNGKAIGPDIKYMPEWRAFGWFTAVDRVEWDVDVEETGNYSVDLEWAVSDEEAGKEFLLQSKDQQLTGIVEKSGSWETFKKAPVGSIHLEAGVQKLVFRSNKNFDKGAMLDFRAMELVRLK